MNDPDTTASATAPSPEEGAGNAGAATGGSLPSLQKGKVYKDSASLYDDEARVAFEYFKKAAAKIVAEEDAVLAKKEKAQADVLKSQEEAGNVEGEIISCDDDAKRAKFWFLALVIIVPLFFTKLWFLGLLLLAAPIFGITKLLGATRRRTDAERRLGKIKDTIAEGEKILAGIDGEFKAIKRDYAISKLGVAYVPVATQVPFGDKSLLLDDTGHSGNKMFELYQVKQQDDFVESIASFREQVSKVPIAESDEAPESILAKPLVPSFESVWMNDYIGGMDRNLRAISYYLGNLDKTSVSMPVVPPGSKYAKFLEEYCTSETEGAPVLEVFDNSKFKDSVERLKKMDDVQKKMTYEDESLDNVLEKLIGEIAEGVQYIGQAKVASVEKVLSACGDLLLNTFNASYNHYSPSEAKEDLHSKFRVPCPI